MQRPGQRSAAKPRVALVHDWLTGMRGGEKVLEAIVELYPDSTLHTLLHVPGTVSATIEKLLTRCSFVQWLPGSARNYRHYLPVFPTAIEQFDLDAYDLVISTSHCAAKSVVATGTAQHICYCHSPMRYAWDQFHAYFGPDVVGPTRSKWFRPVLARMARWDRDTAGRVDRYVANSHYVAGRIRRYYNRGSTVVHPPVDTDFFRPEPSLEPENRYLVVSALVPYKRVDVAIRACARIGAPLTVVGRGPESDRLQAVANGLGADVTFSGWIDDEGVRDLYRRSRAVVMPGVEDFGMVPVEAQACGRPVVVFAQGGALESVLDGITGIHVPDDTAEAFAEALTAVSTRSWDFTAIRAHAETFGKARFQQEFQSIVDESLERRNNPADRENERESRRAEEDPGEVGGQRPDHPDAGSNAAKHRQRRVNSAARENERESRRAEEDPGEVGGQRPDHPDAGSNAAKYRQRRVNPADRENKQ